MTHPETLIEAVQHFASLDAGSPVVWLIHEFRQRARCHWTQRNKGTGRVLAEAVKANLTFRRDDIAILQKEEAIFSHGSGLPEILYSLAAQHNPTAAASIEHYLGRKPLWYKRQRMYVGRSFAWVHGWVNCTSIQNTTGLYAVACSYMTEADKKAQLVLEDLGGKVKWHSDRQIKKRYKIDQATFRKVEAWETSDDVEEANVGPVVDVRGTEEAQRRFDAIKDNLPAAGVRLAMEEINEQAKR